MLITLDEIPRITKYQEFCRFVLNHCIMTQIRKVLFLVSALLFTLLVSASAQANIELNFQGLLTDSNKEIIPGAEFDFTVKLISSELGTTELWSSSEATSTNEEGWFSFSIPEISQYLNLDEDVKKSVVIRMDFLPNSKTTWLNKGEDLMVTYTLTPTMKDDALYLKMSRMEGSELTTHLEDHLYAFKDEYPFAYLTGGFLLTDMPPLNNNSIDDLKQWLLPETSVKGPATRGVRGTFPKGGYRKH